jgi:hypothetical protein
MAEFDNTRSFFDTFSSAAAQDLRTLQLTAGSPEPTDGIGTVTDPVIPDRLISDRLSHFDPAIYDLRDESHLMKLLKVLLGGAGVGGPRKQLIVARLQNVFNGMHFLDLDRFYGALFGVKRAPSELYRNPDFDPYSDGTTPDEWDDVHSRDASYRDRLSKFARTIPLGGTYTGIKAMAEALLAADCEIYESWSIVEEKELVEATPNSLVYTFATMEDTYGTWGAIDGLLWETFGGGVSVDASRTGHDTRSDIVIQPKRSLTPTESYELLRVLDRFRPAGTTMTISSEGIAIHTRATVRNVAADSEFWEVVPRLTANPNLVVPRAGFDDWVGAKNAERPRPAFSQYQGEEWSYNDDIVSVASYTIGGPHDSSRRGDDQTVYFSDGHHRHYAVADAVMPGEQAMSARIVSDGVMTSGAYAASRGLAKRSS